MTQDQDINQRSGITPSIAGSIDSVNLLKDAARDICALAKQHQQDGLLLLSLLRDLEQIHRRIRVDYFESALPQTRNDLYQFVRDIEDKGGWPYIERMRLRDLLKNLELRDVSEEGTTEKTNSQPQQELPEV